MNIAISPQRPSYKGSLHFDEDVYLGVIAFGNALGNSIVSGIAQRENLQKLQDKISNIKVQGADDLNLTLPDLNNSKDYLNSLANINPKEVAVNDRTGIDVGATNVRNADYQADLTAKQSSLNTITAKINSFDKNRYQFGEPLINTDIKSNGISGVNDQTLKSTINDYFTQKLNLGLGDLNKPLSDYEFNNIDSYRDNQSLLTKASNFANGLGFNAGVLSVALKNGWGTVTQAGKNLDLFWHNPQLTNFTDWKFAQPLMGSIDKGFSLLSPFISGLNASNETFNNPDGYDFGDGIREWGKVGVDTAAALTEFKALASFNPAGLIYTGVDLAVQNLPAYTLKFGSQAGQQKAGWTGLLYRFSDTEAQRYVNGTTWIGPKY